MLEQKADAILEEVSIDWETLIEVLLPTILECFQSRASFVATQSLTRFQKAGLVLRARRDGVSRSKARRLGVACAALLQGTTSDERGQMYDEAEVLLGRG